MKVSIIGSGVSGICAAIRLKSKGFDVEVYEKNKMLSKKEYGEQFNYQNLSKKFELSSYEDEIRTNIYNKMISKILIDLANLK